MMRNKLVQHSIKKPKQPVEGLFCLYAHRTCMHNRLEGYDYCIKHILEDKNGPFKQCSYISLKNGKRCINAAPKLDKKDGYCAEHAKSAAISRQKSSRKRQPSESAESLLESIDHYKTYDVIKTRPKLYTDASSSKILEYASSSDSDAEYPMVDQAWRGDGESDAESVDSEQEDYLKYAGVYTAEEVALITRDKLIRLQSLYIDQFKRLQHIMKEKRRKYLQTYKQEREALGNIKDYKEDPNTRHKYEKLKYIKRYHRRYGKEALLHRQSKQRRIAVSEGANYRPPSYPKCVNLEGNTKCTERALPLSKYCTKHILNDTHQALFRQCSFADCSCSCPVASWEEDATCFRHTPLNECEPRVHLVEGEKEESLVLTKEALENLLPELELNAQDLMLGNHILGQNPEFPDLIFSGSDHEQVENKDGGNNGETTIGVNTNQTNDINMGENNRDGPKVNGSCSPSTSHSANHTTSDHPMTEGKTTDAGSLTDQPITESHTSTNRPVSEDHSSSHRPITDHSSSNQPITEEHSSTTASTSNDNIDQANSNLTNGTNDEQEMDVTNDQNNGPVENGIS